MFKYQLISFYLRFLQLCGWLCVIVIALLLFSSFSHANPLFDKAYQVLDKHCFSCHGTKKKKGDLRLHDKKYAYKGGETGELSIIPGKPYESSIILKMLLPVEFEDTMPPPKKPRPTEAELAVLIKWIETGAHWPSKNKKTVEEDGMINLTDEDMIDVSEDQVSDLVDRIAEYKNDPIKILPSAWAPSGLDLNLTHTEFTRSVLARVKELRPHIVTLDLGRVNYLDKILPLVKEMPLLDNLQLNRSSVNDQTLKLIGKASNLRILNLYNTKVSDKSIPLLSTFSKLEKLYLGNTEFTQNGITKLRKKLPHCKIISPN